MAGRQPQITGTTLPSGLCKKLYCKIVITLFPYSPINQFNRFDPEDGRISERDFAKMVLSYADMNDQQRKKYMKRVKREYGDRKVRE